MKTLTKRKIENLADKITQWAKDNKLGQDWLLFYNGNVFDPKKPDILTKSNPLDYCEYFSDQFIMGMVFDGKMYDCLNNHTYQKAYRQLEKLLSQYGLYIEYSTYTACQFCNESNDKVEYWTLPRKKILFIYGIDRCSDYHTYEPHDYPKEFNNIMKTWYRLSEQTGDIGSCTIGEYLQFDYKENTYRMSPQTPYQGDFSWQKPLPKIKQMLTEMGAENIYVNYGRLD